MPKDFMKKVSRPLLFFVASLVFVAACFVVIFLLPKIVQFHTPLINLDGISAPLQILYLEKFPLRLVNILFNSYTNHIEAYYKSIIGTYGSIHFYLYCFFYTFYLAVIFALIYLYSKFN